MENQQINIMELWNIIDSWHDNDLSIDVIVMTKDGVILQGVATTGKYISEYIKEARPTHIYINESHRVMLCDIRTIEFDNCCYTVTSDV
ncbi:MAG: hypothetical protein J6V21_06460 [Alistipes sp.]|nr:hypothetical protein [Alistipes sp.]